MIRHLHKDYIPISLLGVYFVLFVLLLIFLGGVIKGPFFPKDNTSQKVVSEPIVYNQSVFDQANIKAKAYIVYDIVDKTVIAKRNETTAYPLASLTKIMTAVTALTHNGTSTPITIKSTSIDGAYDLGLKKGQIWTLEELLKYTLLFSSNDGAQAVADAFGGTSVFVEQMNTTSASLGLRLVFTDPAGLDKGEKLGGEGSAHDMALLFAHARKMFPEILDATGKTRGTFIADTGKVIGIPNTNQEIEKMFGAEASKTGFTDDAGGNLAIIVDISLGHPVAIVVLGSTREERFSDIETLYNLTKKSLKP